MNVRAFALALALVGCSGGAEQAETAVATDAATVAETQTPTDSAIDVMDDAIAPEDFTNKGPHPTSKKDAKLGSNAVHVVFPTDAPPAPGFPGVAFAHGFQLQPANYDLLLEHLASWGYVVVSTDFPGSLFSIDHNDVAKALVAARSAMAMGSIAGVPKVDGAKIAAAGHSLGGKGAVMAVLAEPAFHAALAFDPVDGNPGNPLGGAPDAMHPRLIPDAVAKVAVPIGYFGATQSHCGANACAPTGLDAAAFFAATRSSVPRYLWTVFDLGHMQFLDNPMCGFTCSVCASGKSAIEPRRVAVHATAVAFLRRHLEGDVSAQTWLDGAKHDAHVAAKLFWDGKVAPPGC